MTIFLLNSLHCIYSNIHIDLIHHINQDINTLAIDKDLIQI